jgi:3-phenylpropionate/cinnamic acid dioxygenase small subunit
VKLQNRAPLDVLCEARRQPRDLQQEIEQFLFYEAALLNDRQFDAWYDLLADDLRYYAPLRTTRSSREQDREFGGPDDIAFFDDSKASMALRVKRLQTSSAWAEEPPSRTRRFLTNIRIAPAARAGEFEVASAFLLYRNRAERQTDLFAGERLDGLRRCEGPSGFQIFARTILIDQSTLTANNISVFF